MSLRLGEQIPTPSTTFTPIATGAATGNPLTTFAYRDVGVILDITPRVTLDNDIILDVFVDNSAQGGNILVNGISAPTFSTRSVTARLRLRDGESNLIAGLLRDDDRKSVKEFPGAINIPVLKQLFSSNNNSRTQTDIVMLLTPRIIRGKQITEEDLRPIFIGSGQGFGLNGPPPLIAAAEGAPIQTAGGPSPATGSGTTQAGAPAPGVLLVPPPGSSPVPGTVAVPVPSATPVQTPAATQPPPTSAPPQTQTGAAAATPGAGAVPPIADARSSNPPLPRASTASTAGGGAQVTLTPPPSARVGGGPYTVPLTVNDASRLSTVTIVITFDPTRLRARSVQEGSFMRSGGVKTVFSQQASAGRVDIAVTRPADTLGASGSGALGAILFDVLAPGPVTISMSGVATSPGGGLVPLDLRSTSFTIEP
jgi:hypothetical protein